MQIKKKFKNDGNRLKFSSFFVFNYNVLSLDIFFVARVMHLLQFSIPAISSKDFAIPRVCL